MYFVYLIQSINFPEQTYIGHTINITARLKTHNFGQSFHTSKHKPWEIIACFGFKSESKAIEFEKYLKSGSGRAFANKHLW